MKKKEIIIIVVILLAAGLALGIQKYTNKNQYGTIDITVRGKDFGTYSLGKDQIIEINGTNTCTIKDGKAYMSDALCPDHLCMEFDAITENGGMIVCLPNQVVIEGNRAPDADKDAGLDSMA